MRTNRKKMTADQLGVTQNSIELDMADLNVVTIAEIICENSSRIIKAKLQKNDVKNWCIFKIISVKNEDKSDEKMFSIYFHTDAEQILIENCSETVTGWLEVAFASLKEWLERGSGAKFLALRSVNLYIPDYKSSIGKGLGEERLPPGLFKKGRILNIVGEPSTIYTSCLHPFAHIST